MFGWFRQGPTSRPWWRRPAWLAGLVLVVLLGVVAGRHLWAGYHFRRAEEALERGAVPRARRHLARCLKVWPRGTATRLLAARAARLAGAFAEAERHLRVAEEVGGDTPPLRLEGHLLEMQRGSAGPVLEALLWALIDDEHPQVDRLFEALTLGYLYSYRLGQAQDCLARWLAQGPDNPRALYLRGLLREGLQDFTGAGKDYRRAVELAPEHDAARRRLAEYLLHTHHADEAAEHFEHLRRDDPDDAALRFGLARCRREQGEVAAARALLDELLAEQQPQFAWLVERARLAQAEEDHDGAEQWFRQALALDDSDAEVCYAYASCLERRGARTEARRWRARGKEIDRDLAQLRHLHEQIGKRPGDAELRYQAALLCLRNGQKEEGRRWLLSVLRLDPAHQRARQALAESDAGP
jgi:tetratricopeptide (TPR) repeat protein